MADNPTNALTNQEVVKQGSNELRRTIQHLPAFYRTDTNSRFLSSTLDPLIQKGSLERLDGFIGRQDAYTRKITDRYISATSRDRFAYQLEPAVTYTDKDTTSVNPEDQVKFTGTYDDYINQIKYFGGKIENHDRLNKEKVYSWNPAIDYDKLVNYRDYFWMPEGPNAIEIDTIGPSAVVEYKVEAWPVDGSSARAWNLLHRENERNPIVTLYRGNTYKFNVNAKGHPLWIMTEPYKDKLSADGSTSTLYTTGVTNNGTADGTVTFTVPTSAPDTLYYQCGNHDAMYGVLQIKTIDSNKKLNPANDIIGVKTLGSWQANTRFKFTGEVIPATYAQGAFYVEGVGDKIRLIPETSLNVPSAFTSDIENQFDFNDFVSRPYAKAFYRPDTQDYITIKRDSLDQNAWSRYNRWFHKSVVETSNTLSDFTPTLLETDRAKRPIIEFDSGLALYNHGTTAKTSVTLYDTVTTDAFSSVVNQTGYIVDGLNLADGMRVIFAADTDPIVKNKIYTVNFVNTVDSTLGISLTEASDATPANNESIFIEFGIVNQGKTYYYNSTTELWTTSQNKTKVNQQPLFGMWNNSHKSFDDETTYLNSTFAGAKVFAFAISDTAFDRYSIRIESKIQYNQQRGRYCI